LQQGQKLYSAAMQNQLQDQLQGFQLKDLLEKRKREKEAEERQAMIDRTVIGAYRPAVAGTPAQMVEEEGRYIGETPAVASRAAMLDINSIAPILMATSQGRRTFDELVKAQESLQPKLQTLKKGEQLGIVQDGQFKPIAGAPKPVVAGEDNPFLMFSQDQTIPANIRSLAGQYAKSYSNGLIDTEKVDERVRQLSEMTQRVQQFEQTQAGLQQQRAATNLIAQGNQQIQKMMAEAKIEEKAAKKAEQANTKSEAKDQLTATVEQLKGKYDTLLQEGGIVSTKAGGMENIGARLSSSGVGRAVGGAVGTKTQEQRQSIEQTRPLLLNLIKNATGMSAQQMNSNAEMQLYLNAATNPDLSYEANMDALKNLDRLFGLGTAADKIEKSVTAPQKPGKSRSGW